MVSGLADAAAGQALHMARPATEAAASVAAAQKAILAAAALADISAFGSAGNNGLKLPENSYLPKPEHQAGKDTAAAKHSCEQQSLAKKHLSGIKRAHSSSDTIKSSLISPAAVAASVSAGQSISTAGASHWNVSEQQAGSPCALDGQLSLLAEVAAQVSGQQQNSQCGWCLG